MHDQLKINMIQLNNNKIIIGDMNIALCYGKTSNNTGITRNFHYNTTIQLYYWSYMICLVYWKIEFRMCIQDSQKNWWENIFASLADWPTDHDPHINSCQYWVVSATQLCIMKQLTASGWDPWLVDYSYMSLYQFFAIVDVPIQMPAFAEQVGDQRAYTSVSF